MSKQVPQPQIIMDEDGEPRFVYPKVTCDDCGNLVRYPERVHDVGSENRQICTPCWRMPRQAPSVTHFKAKQPR